MFTQVLIISFLLFFLFPYFHSISFHHIFFYLDPQVHTVDSNSGVMMTKGNLGVRGIKRFLDTHKCNVICNYLKYEKQT